MSEISIQIKKCIVHILDSELQVPVLSDSEIEITGEIEYYIFSHLEKYIQSDNMKTCFFDEDNSHVYPHVKLLSKDMESFIPVSKNMAHSLFSIMLKHVDIPSADLVFVFFEADHIPYLALLKMNYKTSYIHFVEDESHGHTNKIIKQKTTLPTEKQKLDEVILINLENQEIKLMEKRYDINGNKDFYLSSLFLGCEFEKSNTEKFNIVNNTLKSMNKKYFDEDIEQSINIKKAMLDSVEESGVINLDKVADVAFEDNIELRNEFTDVIQKKGVPENYVTFQSEIPKKIEKQRIKTDTGIEINIPLDQYGNSDLIEFVNNADGTISILIKSVQKITGR